MEEQYMHLTPEPSLQPEVGCYQMYMYLDVIRALFFGYFNYKDD